MVLKRVRRRLHYVTTETDGGRLTVWVSIALAAGALPSLLIGVSTILDLPQYSLLLIGWTIAGLFALIYAVENSRRQGIAVFIHLPGRGDVESPLTQLSEFADLVFNKHRAWFRTGPEPAAERLHSTADRVRWTFTTIEHRLAESAVVGFSNEPLFLYLQCRQAEAVELGRRLHTQVVGEERGDTLSARTSLEVRYLSRHSDRDDVHRIDLARSFSSAAHRPVCQIHSVELLNVDTHVIRPARIALIIRAGSWSQSAPQAFISTAKRAAAGETSTPYQVTETDSCSWAVVVQIDNTRLIDLLKDGAAHGVVAEIRAAYRDLCRQKFGLNTVPVRLLSDGPTILLTALAATIGDIRLVPWNENSSTPTSPEIFALIDGDDVGTRMEYLLLSDEQREAVRHSNATDGAISTVVGRLSTLPGVTHLSTGGDSALFALDKTSVQEFSEELSQQRATLDFKISCGYRGEHEPCFFRTSIS